jgi:hypothetical protein
MRFNPPPNWPQLPDGWSPPPGWEPDPSWPQPPWGWPLWVDEDEAFISPNQAAGLPPNQLPWYRRTVTVVLSLILFFPVGLVLLWMRPDWSVRRRGAITALTAVLVVVIGATNNHQPTATTQLSPAKSSSLTSVSSGSPSASTSATALPAPPSTTPPKSSTPTVAAVLAPAPTTHATPPPPAPTTQAPQPQPSTKAPPPKPSTCGAPSNPYGYNFCGVGGFVTSPPGDICSYFDCINNFGNGHGYMVECNDGTYSMSGGISGACSYHKGEDRPVYSG